MIEKKLIVNNYTKGREGNKPEFVVVHTYDGKGRSLYNWFNTPTTQASSHYDIFLDGDGEQYVEEKNTAWHSGVWDANIKSIGIEHQDNGVPTDVKRTDEMYEASAQLIASIYTRYGWDKKNQALIKPHKEFSPNRTCPGGLDITRIRRRVIAILKGNEPDPEPALKIQLTKIKNDLDDIIKKL